MNMDVSAAPRIGVRIATITRRHEIFGHCNNHIVAAACYATTSHAGGVVSHIAGVVVLMVLVAVLVVVVMLVMLVMMMIMLILVHMHSIWHRETRNRVDAMLVLMVPSIPKNSTCRA